MWINRFQCGNKDALPKRLKEVTHKLKKVTEIVRNGGHLTFRKMAEELSKDTEIASSISITDFSMKNFCTKIVPKTHSGEQEIKETTTFLNSFIKILEILDLLEALLPSNDSWVFHYHSETKCQYLRDQSKHKCQN
jgi:hypothetical protein